METRASYMVVGAFALLAVIGALAFVLWAARNDKGAVRDYVVVFRQSVSGLSVGNDVLLNGVRVGQVAAIRISPKDPGSVWVRLAVSSDAPIRENSMASLEPQGLTGLSVVAVTGGTADSPLIKDSPDKPALIPSQLSRLQTIMASVPQLLNSLHELVERGNAMLSPENAKSVAQLLDSLSNVADTLSDRRPLMEEGMNNLSEASKSVASLTKKLENLTGSAQRLVDKNFTDAADSVNKAAARLDAMIRAVEPGMTRVSRESADELQRLLVEARRLMTNLGRLAQKMESDPRRFLFGNPVPEFSTP